MKSTDEPFGVQRLHSDLLTRRQAAAYLGVCEQTLAVWKCTGRYQLPFVKIGRLVKYRKLDLDAFIQNNLRN
jgi:excisionase family DNA binding protein